MTDTHAAPTIVEPVDGGKYYTIDDVPYVRVTTILDGLADLTGWSAWLAAQEACDNVPALMTAMLVAECGRTNARCKHDRDVKCGNDCACRKCLPCTQRRLANLHFSEKARRAREGSEFHKYAQTWVEQNGARIPVTPEVEPYVATFHKFIDDYELAPDSFYFCEAVAVNAEQGYAGTCDGALLIKAVNDVSADFVARILGISVAAALADGRSVKIMIDYKTREKESTDEDGNRTKPIKLYPSQAMQLTAYRRSPKLWIKQTERYITMPEFDAAAIIQIRPDDYTFRPVVADENTYQAFLAQKAVWSWLTEFGTASVSVRSFKAAPKKRAPRSTASDSKSDGASTATQATDSASPTTTSGEPATPAAETPTATVTPAPAAPTPEVSAATARRRARKAAAAKVEPVEEQTRAAVTGSAEKPDGTTLFPKPNAAVHPDSPYGDDIPF